MLNPLMSCLTAGFMFCFMNSVRAPTPVVHSTSELSNSQLSLVNGRIRRLVNTKCKQPDVCLFLCFQMWMSVNVSTQRSVRRACVWTTSPDTAATAPVDMFTTAWCWSVSVRTPARPLSAVSTGETELFVFISDHDECEEESCVGGLCVNTVGSYYCSCLSPLVLDDTQRNCVNASHLTIGETHNFLLLFLRYLICGYNYFTVTMIPGREAQTKLK